MPQTAIADARNIIIASTDPHFPAIATFAAIGPMTHSMNADEHPKKARIALKPGTSIDIMTDSNVTLIRWAMRKPLFNLSREAWALPVAVVEDDGRGTAMPSKISSVEISGLVVSANFDLWLQVSTDTAGGARDVQRGKHKHPYCQMVQWTIVANCFQQVYADLCERSAK